MNTAQRKVTEVSQLSTFEVEREPGEGACLPEVSALAVLRQDVGARPLEVQHAAVEGAIVRVSKGDAGGGSREAVRAAQAGHDGWHLVLGENTV